MDNVEFIAFDLETTGLSPDFNRIVEVGAIRLLADGTELDRMEQLVDPRCAIPTDVTKIHGITDKMVRGEPPIEDVLPEFLEFLGFPETILLAHNASFDVGFLTAAFSRCKAILPEHPVVDTLALSRWTLPRLRNHRLETVARHLHITDSTEHRALGDAFVVQSVFLKLLAQVPTITITTDLFSLVPPIYFEPMISGPITVPTRYNPLVKAIEIGRSISIVYAGGTKSHWKRSITPVSLKDHS
jgi:DNA polymerase-3 subunit alpha (Gram-positive type)